MTTTDPTITSTTTEADAARPERRDFGYIYQRGDTYWIRYSIGGKRLRESAHTTSRRKAQQLLAQRQAELGLGIFTAPDAKRLTFADLAGLIRDDYRVRGRRTLTVRSWRGASSSV